MISQIEYTGSQKYVFKTVDSWKYLSKYESFTEIV